MSAPVIAGNQVKFNVMLTLSLEVKDLAAKNDVIRKLPRLRDAMLRDLHASPVVRNEEAGRFDLDAIKARMTTVARRVITNDLVRDVLVVSAVRLG